MPYKNNAVQINSRFGFSSNFLQKLGYLWRIWVQIGRSFMDNLGKNSAIGDPLLPIREKCMPKTYNTVSSLQNYYKFQTSCRAIFV
jgi:hypothetical protein